jgi:hypothetical protein
MMNLIEILSISGISLHNYKIHFATGSNPSPMEAYFKDSFKEWQEEQTKRNFQCDMILSLIQLHDDQWLFAGVYKILGVNKQTEKHFIYQTELIPQQDELIGRIVIKYKKPFRASYLIGEKFGHHLELVEIKPQRISIEPFPGYNRVIISHDHLCTIFKQQDISWKTALSNVKGIYLILDRNTLQMYVGSATGIFGIWQRWDEYSKTKDGGDVELKKIIEEKGREYASNFQYSILEIADFHSTDLDILKREQHWKNVLKPSLCGN